MVGQWISVLKIKCLILQNKHVYLLHLKRQNCLPGQQQIKYIISYPIYHIIQYIISNISYHIQIKRSSHRRPDRLLIDDKKIFSWNTKWFAAEKKTKEIFIQKTKRYSLRRPECIRQEYKKVFVKKTRRTSLAKF